MRLLASLLLLTPLTVFAAAPGSQTTGYWREPGGSVLRVETCGADLCLRIVSLRANPPARFDIHNPDAGLHTRPLCGLEIGTGFHATSPTHAGDGTLYDPESGRTYHGQFTAEGDKLHLRGYVGVPLFGRSETWTRTTPAPTCTQ